MRPRSRNIHTIITLILVFGFAYGIQASCQTQLPEKIRIVKMNEERVAEGELACDIAPYWQALAAQRNNEITAHWNARIGTPSMIFGSISDSFGKGSEASAREFLV